jgi:tetratricopeptide (TPR) repeat protein
MKIGELIKNANRLKREGKLDEAIAEYRHILELNPNFAWAYYNLGEVLAAKGFLEEALVELNQAIHLEPNCASFHIQLGKVFVQLNDFEKAIESLSNAIKIKPNLFYYFETKYKKMFSFLFNKKSREFLAFGEQEYEELTNEPKWAIVSVDPNTNYYLTGQSASEQLPTSKQAVVQFEFLDEEKKLILEEYEGIGKSKKIGYYFYIPTSCQELSSFEAGFFRTPATAKYVRLGFRTWSNNQPIILASKMMIKYDFLKELLTNNSRDIDKQYSIFNNTQYLIENDYKEVIYLLNKIIKILPDYSIFYSVLGDLCLSKKDMHQAIRAYRQASDLNSNYSIPYDQLRKMYEIQNLNQWAISENLFLYILETLPVGSTILELGSGTGTGELSKYYNLFSIEHDKAWLNKYNSSYIYAPLVNDSWYNPKILKTELLNLNYDLLLIDGPPQHRRAGILENLNLFNLNIPIIIDDVNRKVDRDIMIAIASHLGKLPKIYEGNKYFAVIS